MPDAFFKILSLALLLAAAGLLLWMWAARRQTRLAASQHLDQQLKAMPTSNASSTGNANGTPAFDYSAYTNYNSPSASETPAAPARNKRFDFVLPGWLLGVVTVKHLVVLGVAILFISLLVLLLAGWISAIGALALLLLFSSFGLWLRVQKFRRMLVSQLPGFLDSMVRLITIGNSTHAAFQLSIPTIKPPLQQYMENASSLVRAGMELDQALMQLARNVRIEELHLLAAVLGLGVRYGGRADVLLERMANFMRDQEQANHELIAMSSETRLSAWILGLLPVGVGGAIIMLNTAYFTRMWNDSTGQLMIFAAFGLQLFGAFLLYRLARLS